MKVFGDFQFDEASMKLTRAGERVRLTGQALELLVLLIERPGELITREEIQCSLWPDSRVEFEHSIDVVLNRLRRALGDNSKDPRYIQTIPRKGYRFVEPVNCHSSQEEVVHPAWTGRLKTYAAVACLVAAVTFLILHARYDKVVRSRAPHSSPTSQTR